MFLKALLYINICLISSYYTVLLPSQVQWGTIIQSLTWAPECQKYCLGQANETDICIIWIWFIVMSLSQAGSSQSSSWTIISLAGLGLWPFPFSLEISLLNFYDICFAFFNPTASATAYGQRPKFSRANIRLRPKVKIVSTVQQTLTYSQKFTRSCRYFSFP